MPEGSSDRARRIFPAPSFPFSHRPRRVSFSARPARICEVSNHPRDAGHQTHTRMAEIKFRCPECTQKIAVAESAAGVKIDCPTCHSRLVIPRSEIAPVEVLIRRKLAIVGGSADAVYQELQKMEAQAEKAADELKQVRAESAATAQKARLDLEALLSVRETLETEIASLRPLKDQLAKAQQDLASAAEQEAQLAAARNSAAALRAEFTGLQTTHGETQNRLTTMTEQLGALQRERDEFANTAVAETAELRGQIAGARQEIDREQSDAKMLAETNRTLSAQLDAAKGAEAGVRAELAAALAQHTQAESQLAEQATKLAGLETEQTRLAAIAGELAPLREELAKSQRDLCNICESAAEKARGYEEQLEAAKNSGAELRANLGDSQSKHAAAQKQLAEQASRLETVVKRVTELQPEAAAAKTLRENFAEAQNELERLRTQAELGAAERDEAAKKHAEALSKTNAAEKVLREYSDALQAKLTETEQRHAAVSHGFTALKQERADLSNELSASWKDRDAAATKSAGQSNVIEKLASEMETAKGEFARLRGEAEAAARDALAKTERDAAEAAELRKKHDAEKAALAEEVARKLAELDALKNEAARTKAELDQIRTQPRDTGAGTASPTEREKALEAERDALTAALDRAKQHVGVLQARRDMLRDEVAALRSRLGIGGQITSADEKPIAK